MRVSARSVRQTVRVCAYRHEEPRLPALNRVFAFKIILCAPSPIFISQLSTCCPSSTSPCSALPRRGSQPGAHFTHALQSVSPAGHPLLFAKTACCQTTAVSRFSMSSCSLVWLVRGTVDLTPLPNVSEQPLGWGGSRCRCARGGCCGCHWRVPCTAVRYIPADHLNEKSGL